MNYRQIIEEIVHEEPYRRVRPLLAFLIFLFPIFFVWLLLRDGHTARSRIIGFGWFAFWVFTPFYVR